MPTATWQGVVIAEADADQIEMVEGNVYFPVNAIKHEFFQGSDKHTVCPWKGTASYYDVVVEGQVNQAAAWYYPEPKDAAKQIKDFVAFWKGVQVKD